MKVLLLAGEESGVLYAKDLAQRLRDRDANMEIRTYQDYGFQTHDLAVMGFVAVLRRLFFFLNVRRTMMRAIDTWRPDVVCTIDYPGLNLKLAAHAKRRGIKAVHVVCPQVWAWRAGRIPKIERALDHLFCFFPFEPALFSKGFATFVGHPLAHAFAQMRPSRENATPVVALLPGSRAGEIARHVPPLLKAVEGLNADVVIPAVHARAFAQIKSLLGNAAPRVRVQEGGARELLLRADCAVVASGTATLEAALASCPTVLVYRVSPLLAWFARRVIKGVHYVGLVNIVWEKMRGLAACGETPPMPELLQEDFTPARVRECLDTWLENPSAREAASRRLSEVCALLSVADDPLERVAAAVCELVKGARP